MSMKMQVAASYNIYELVNTTNHFLSITSSIFDCSIIPQQRGKFDDDLLTHFNALDRGLTEL